MTVKDAVTAKANRTFVDFLEGELTKRGWSLPELGRRMGKETSTSLRHVLAGRARAAPKTLKRIAAALDDPDITPERLASLYLPVTSPRREIAKVTLDVSPSEEPSFSVVMNRRGGMHVRLDMPDVPAEQAFKLLDVLRAIGMFG